MAAGIANTALVDLTRTTTNNLPTMNFEVALENQVYVVVNKWFTEDKIDVDSGIQIQRNIVLDPQGNARHVRLYQRTAINVPEGQVQITAPWVQAQTFWSIERREALRNRKPSMFIPLIKSRRVSAAVDYANLLERRAWQTPEDSNDDLNPQGLPYWLNKVNASVTSTGDFIGQTIRFNTTGTTTTKGGIDGSLAANANWRNWAFTYTTINEDFIKRMREAFHATNFQSPVSAKDLEQGPRSNFRIYMGREVLVEYETLTTRSNDNLGRDLHPFHDNTTFKNVPVVHAPRINNGNDSEDPVFGVNHMKFFPITLEGDWMRETEPMTDVEQHNVITTFLEGSYQFFCNNVREAGFVGSLVPAT